jgi:phenylpropionate dioxygenase-like ring-hydroxylating dioxygenase large terminal subunit
MFLAHTSDINPGLSKPLIQCYNKKFLSNVDGEFRLFNNICPHQGSLILSKLSTEISCQYHGWSWTQQGTPCGTGCTKLVNDKVLFSSSTYVTNGLVFGTNVDLTNIGVDFRQFTLTETRVDHVKTDYRNIMNVFLDVDHIPVVHKDVYEEIGITDDVEVQWDYHDWGSIQSVVPKKEISTQHAAVWIAVYPFTMIEWQPGAMFVTVSIPRESGTDVLVKKYISANSDSKQWQMNERIWETAWSQDKHQAESIMVTVPKKMLEEQKVHFLDWVDNAAYTQ